MLTYAEKIELGVIAVGCGGVAWGAQSLPAELSLGAACAVLALGLLGQGLVRDLYILKQMRQMPRAAQEAEEMSCMCVESTIGLGGVVVGVVLTAVGLTVQVSFSPMGWVAMAATTWLAGFLMKDWVIQWWPWQLRRVKNHGSIVVRWGSK
jgi:hypothetical protein